MDEKDVFNFAGSSLLLRKLRVDMKEDPDTIERLVGNKAAKVGTEETDQFKLYLCVVGNVGCYQRLITSEK